MQRAPSDPTSGISLARTIGARLQIPLLAATSAVMISVSLPEDSISVLAWVCLVPLLAAIHRCRTGRGSALTIVVFVLLFGSIYTRWLPGTVATFFRLSTTAGWLTSLGVYAAFGLLPIGLFAVLTHRVLHRHGRWTVFLVVPAIWVATEFFRVHLLGGLPWALLGHALYQQPLLIQIADLGGVFAISFVIATVNVGIYQALSDRSGDQARLRPLAAAIMICAATGLYGQVRLEQFDRPGESTATVGLLQPNRPPVYQWSQMAADRALLAYLRQTQQYFGGKNLDVIVWPENAIPLYPDRDLRLGARLARFGQSLNTALVVGAPGSAPEGDVSSPYNAAHLITPAVGVTSTYRKQRLVPFAEYQPWPRSAEAADPRASAFSAGSTAVIFEIGAVRWGPTICLDFVFADVVRNTVLAGAEVLLNLSNDSWLVTGGPGAAVQQHVQAIYRAVENRRDVARATTTGISAGVNAAGIPFAILEEGKAGGLVVTVSPRSEISFYTRFGDVFSLGCALVGLVALHPGTRRRDQRDRTRQKDTERVGFEPTRG